MLLSLLVFGRLLHPSVSSYIYFVPFRCCFGHVGAYYHWIALILCTAFAASGVGYIAGVVVSSNSSNVFAIVAILICCVFAGVEPTLRQVNKYPVVNWPWYLSYGTWTAEAAFYVWTKYLDDFGKVQISLQDGADVFGYDVEHGLNRSIGALLGLGIAMRLIAVFILWWKSKK